MHQFVEDHRQLHHLAEVDVDVVDPVGQRRVQQDEIFEMNTSVHTTEITATPHRLDLRLTELFITLITVMTTLRYPHAFPTHSSLYSLVFTLPFLTLS